MTRLFPPIPPRWQGTLNHWHAKLRAPSAKAFNQKPYSNVAAPKDYANTPPLAANQTVAGQTLSTLTPLTAQPLQHKKDVQDSSNRHSTIVTHHLSKTFNIEHTHPCHALTNVNLDIPQGTVQIMMGPSGAGKTTLLLCLAGLLDPTAGMITLLGQNLSALSLGQLEHFRRLNIGMVFQDSNLLRSLTAMENVEAMLQFRGIQRHAARRQAKDLLNAVGLYTHRNHLPRQLSGGQQQRVSVARALAGYPPVILADEPTAALDSGTGHKVVEFMKHIAQNHGCTIIMTTHDPRILDVGDRTLHLHDGQLQPHSPLVS